MTLIEDLKAKIDADGATEQKIYDKFACWCESTTQRKVPLQKGRAGCIPHGRYAAS